MFKKFLDDNFGLLESVICAVFGIFIIATDVIIAPATIPSVVVGGILSLVGVVGIVLNFAETHINK